MKKPTKKLCKNCQKKPVYVKQALYCRDCSKMVARAQRRRSNQKRRAEQYRNARLKPVMVSPKKLTWVERRARIVGSVSNEHRYTNLLTPRQMRELKGAAVKG